MTGTALFLMIVLALIKLLMTCLPTAAVEGLISKFEMHAKLSDVNTAITIDGKSVEGEDKLQVINYFNESTVLKKYYIFPGNEHLFLYPDNGGIPIIIETKRGKKDLRIFVYSYNDHVDVIRQYKKKVIAYSVLSDSLQKSSMSATRDLV